MGTDQASRSFRFYESLVSVLVIAFANVNASATVPVETTTVDCGVNALFILLRLEGRSVTLDRLQSVLPARHPQGYSMAELAAAAGTLGLRLEGVRFTKGDKALERPAIAFLKEANGGHFAVLRPVGTTGTMVQVIDPPAAPWIADYERIFSAKPWSGRVLVPRDGWALRNAVPLAIGGTGLVLLLTRSALKLSRASRAASDGRFASKSLPENSRSGEP
jgi:Peptidase C39 family